ncbi:hypothetical protein [Streptomyces sp. 4N124]|uniref:hypothetical protein n=1 Tax=Streptomyces sp. 4N124 TaxID=3457420 RepID=UPI003FCF8CB0
MELIPQVEEALARLPEDGRRVLMELIAAALVRPEVWPPSTVVDRAREIVQGYAPLKVTLRQAMYRLASEGACRTRGRLAALPYTWRGIGATGLSG